MTKNFAVMALISMALFISAVAQASVGFDFAANTQGWAAEDWGNGLPTLSWTSFNGGSLQADTSSMSVPGAPGNWAKAYLKGALSSPTNLTSTPIYSLDVYVPSTMWVKAKLSVNTAGGWAQGAETAQLAQNTWQTIAWDMTGTSGIDLSQVTQLGVEITGWYPSPATGTFNIDNASANAAPVPEPASLFLLGTGLVGIFGLKNRKARG